MPLCLHLSCARLAAAGQCLGVQMVALDLLGKKDGVVSAYLAGCLVSACGGPQELEMELSGCKGFGRESGI